MSRWKRAALSLLAAFLLWFSLKVVRPYEVTQNIPVAYRNVPAELTFQRPLPQSLDLRLKGEGHLLLLPMLFRGDTFKIDLQPYISRGYLPTRLLSERIEERYPAAVHVAEISPDTIFLDFEARIRRRVPIQPQVRVTPAPGYLVVEEPVFRPDSVTLTGTAHALANIVRWPTDNAVLQNVQGSRSERVPLTDFDGISIDPPYVRVFVRTERFTEVSQDVKVDVLNAPGGAEVRLLPETVRVTGLVPLERLDEVRLADFRISVDFSKISPQDYYVVPYVLNTPEGVRDVRLEPPYLRYVIETKPPGH